jgi:hypothetical protein
MQMKPNPPRGLSAIASAQRPEDRRAFTDAFKDRGEDRLNENKTAQMLVRVQPTLKAAAERAAREDSRSLSSLIEKLLTEHLKAKGYLK